MCGVVFLSGPRASDRVKDCLARLAHRGPDDQSVWHEGDFALGFARLAINGSLEEGRQPFNHNRWVGAVNGEIFNHRALTSRFNLVPGACDTSRLLPLVNQLGPRVIDELDGFYSAVLIHPSRQEVWCLRDHMGKKPLFVGRSGGELFIVSELKALSQIDWFEMLPLGTSRIDLRSGAVTLLAEHRPVASELPLQELLRAAVKKRLPAKWQPLGVFLSGGLDSSLIAALVSRQRHEAVHYYTLGSKDSADRAAVERLSDILGLDEIRMVSLPGEERLGSLISEVVRVTESYNPSIVSNGLGAYLLAEAAHADGIKVVLGGEGADELFGGYHCFRPGDPWLETRAQLIDDMQLTELRRLDLACMAHSVEVRCPFLDRAVRHFSDNLSYEDMYDEGRNKVVLRNSCRDLLPLEIVERPKVSFDVGSGIRAQVVNYLRRNGRSERDELLRIWKYHYDFDPSASYFFRYPVFDEAIDRRCAKQSIVD